MAQRCIKHQVTQRFLQLSATIPGLDKTRKGTEVNVMFNNSSAYQLQAEGSSISIKRKNHTRSRGRVRELEKESKHASNDDDDDNNGGNTTARWETFSGIPEVEARTSENQVLIKILCHKQNGTMLKIQDELKHLQLSILSKSVMPFGDSTLDITIIAQVGEDYSMTTKDLVKRLSIALLKTPEVDKVNGYVSVWTA